MTANGLAKMLEETGELTQVGAKRLAYFTTLTHPDGAGSLKTRMEEEIADVEASCEFVKGPFELDREAIARRRQMKLALFTRWHADPTNGADSFHAARDEERAVEEAARRMNAEAREQEGEAWKALVAARLRAWRQSLVDRSGDQLALDDFMDKQSLEDLIRFVCSGPASETSDVAGLAAVGQHARGGAGAPGEGSRRQSEHYPEEWGPSGSKRLTCACGNADPGHMDRASTQPAGAAQPAD